MTEEHIPHSWINSGVVLYIDRGGSGGIPGILRDVGPEGITISYKTEDESREWPDISFYPWTSFYRLLKSGGMPPEQ